MKRTPLHAQHLALNAHMTEFHGWQMPLYYTSILDEHKAVRETGGLFDVSHMGQFFIEGPNAAANLNALLVSDIASVGAGRACYTLMLNENGGIIDDLIVYRLAEQRFLLIVNCGRRGEDWDWISQHAAGLKLEDHSDRRGILALQGPRAVEILDASLKQELHVLGRFDFKPLKGLGRDAYAARTGYTGSDGFEIFAPNDIIIELWRNLLPLLREKGGLPVGLGARDTLRVEAGLRLYGVDMDETTTPYDAGLGWTVALGTPQFVGQEVLIRQKQEGLRRRFIGFELAAGPVPRHGMELFAEGRAVGQVTSGTFSPALQRPIGMGYAEAASADIGAELQLEARGRRYAARVVKLPFLKPEQAKRAAG